MTEAPATPVTLDELIVRWAQRDAEYAKQRTPMDLEQSEAVRLNRIHEAERLPNPDERARAYARAYTWVQPDHAEFGGLRDWIELQ